MSILKEDEKNLKISSKRLHCTAASPGVLDFALGVLDFVLGVLDFDPGRLLAIYLFSLYLVDRLA